MTSLNTALVAAQRDLTMAELTYGPSSQEVKDLKSKIHGLKVRIGKEIQDPRAGRFKEPIIGQVESTENTGITF